MNFQFEGKDYALQTGETLLDAMHRHEIDIPAGCRSGICRSCLVSSPNAKAEWQRGLSQDDKKKGYFFSCQAKPEEDLEVCIGEQAEDRVSGEIVEVTDLGGENYYIKCLPSQKIECQAGQFVNLYRPDGLFRPYSLANIGSDEFLEFHIRVLENGQFGNWIKQANAGEKLEIGVASGDCVLPDTIDESNVYLVGTGTGLAPLYGLMKELFKRNYQGEINLYHGSRHLDGLYLDEHLRELQSKHSNLNYYACLSGEDLEGYSHGRVNDVLLSNVDNFKGSWVFVCGHPEMVREVKRNAFLKDAEISKIKSDAFFLQTS